ncbi:MAG: hypothetical protein ACQGVK_16875 [Myxococcota bacterium]
MERWQHTPWSRPSLVAGLLAPLVLLSACKTDQTFDSRDLGNRLRFSSLDSALEADAVLPDDRLRIRLAFFGGADLDLYLTDPLQETIYFARRETRSGGVLLQDVRCDAPPPRIEAAVFPDPAPGVYRIGVDYAGACSDSPRPEGFVLEVVYRGRRWMRRDSIAPMHFEPIVWEVVIPE